MPPTNGLTPEMIAFLSRSECAREIIRIDHALGRVLLFRQEFLLILGNAYPVDVVDETLAKLTQLGGLKLRRAPVLIKLGICTCVQCCQGSVLLPWRC